MADFPPARFIESNGIRMAVHELGEGEPVVLCHGFPELAFSWRHQMPALAAAGFRAIAPDQRGYGETDCPPRIEDYSMRELLADLAGLLDALELKKAVFVGHDWGGAVVWRMALRYPERVRAVAGINTPFLPRPPAKPGPNRPEYQLYFQEPGQAEADLDDDVRRFLALTLRGGAGEEWNFKESPFFEIAKRGGMMAGLPRHPQPSTMISADELDYYVEKFEKTGFRGGLNWYRNMEWNWNWDAEVEGRQVMQPALMVTAGKDPVLTPKMAEGMEAWVPNLTRGHIEDCGHWTTQEQPDALNRILGDWLGALPPA